MLLIALALGNMHWLLYGLRKSIYLPVGLFNPGTNLQDEQSILYADELTSPINRNLIFKDYSYRDIF